MLFSNKRENFSSIIEITVICRFFWFLMSPFKIKIIFRFLRFFKSVDRHPVVLCISFNNLEIVLANVFGVRGGRRRKKFPLGSTGDCYASTYDFLLREKLYKNESNKANKGHFHIIKQFNRALKIVRLINFRESKDSLQGSLR